MKKKQTLSEKQFNSLSQAEQGKELSKLAKRANVRLSLQEEKGLINLAYREAYQHNINQDREKNRFSETKKYKDKESAQQTYKTLSSYLNNKTSTLGGVEQNVKEQIQQMAKNNNIDQQVISKMSTQEKKYASKYISIEANKKLKKLEDEGITQYAYGLAEYYNKAEERKTNRFYRGIKYKNEEDLQLHINNTIHFYNAKTSTPQGVEESVKSRLDKFREKGVYIPIDKEYEFFQFLASEEFKKMGSKVDSNQVFSNYAEARNEGRDAESINNTFKEFLDTNMTFDQVQERIGTARRLFKKKVIEL